jgi:GTP-sensing pleiotropic transcriptional regulator CodY
MNRKWTEAERNFIVENAHRLTDSDIADRLTRSTERSISVNAVRKTRQRLGIIKKSGRGVCELRGKAHENAEQ